jgi:hypothetical protein
VVGQGENKYSLQEISMLIHAIQKFKRYRSPGADQILAEHTEAGGEILCSEIF